LAFQLKKPVATGKRNGFDVVRITTIKGSALMRAPAKRSISLLTLYKSLQFLTVARSTFC